MRVYLIRHGETEYNRTMKVQGHAEIPLNDLGIQQAARLARRFTGVRLDRIYASDLRRATMTAAILAAQTGSPLLYDPGLRERDPGDLTHKDYQESIQFFTDPSYEPPGGETHHDFLIRVRKTFEALIEREVARELWEQGSSGVDAPDSSEEPAPPASSPPASPVPPDSSSPSDSSDKSDPSDKSANPSSAASPRLLDPGLQEVKQARHPTDEFTASGSSASRKSESSSSSPSAEESGTEWDALSPVHVPAAPGIDLDAVPHLALVTHGMVCRAFVELFAPDAPPPGLRWLNTSLSILDYMPKDKKWHVHVLADAGHLEATSITPSQSSSTDVGA